MTRFRCNSCGGVYFEEQPDGSPYYHVCAPLPPDKNGVVKERLDKRDERIELSPPRRSRVPIGIAAEGKGTTCLSDKSLTEPAHLSRLKARIAAGWQPEQRGN